MMEAIISIISSLFEIIGSFSSFLLKRGKDKNYGKKIK